MHPSKLFNHVFSSCTPTALPYVVIRTFGTTTSSTATMDISVSNIVLNSDPLMGKNGGMIIDFDLAIPIDRNESPCGHDYRMGIRAFQSMNVFQSHTPSAAPCKPHDYMDDLESFFYVLCWISCGFAGPGEKFAKLPSQLRKCASANRYDAFNAKVGALTRYFMTFYPATPYFGPVFDTLMGQLSCFFADVDQKHLVSKGKPTLMELKATPSVAYDTILGYVDEAIKALESEPPEIENGANPDPAQAHSLDTFSDLPHARLEGSGKRRSDSLGEDQGGSSEMPKHRHRTRQPSSPSTSHSTSHGIDEDEDEE